MIDIFKSQGLTNRHFRCMITIIITLDDLPRQVDELLVSFDTH